MKYLKEYKAHEEALLATQQGDKTVALGMLNEAIRLLENPPAYVASNDYGYAMFYNVGIFILDQELKRLGVEKVGQTQNEFLVTLKGCIDRHYYKGIYGLVRAIIRF